MFRKRAQPNQRLQPTAPVARASEGETRFQVVFTRRGFPRTRAAGYAQVVGRLYPSSHSKERVR